METNFPGATQSRTASPSGMSSGRIHHIAGDVPPAMSPLDAFAAQSRLLAKQLDDSRKNGRRVSRLPPLAVASSLSKPRPGLPHSESTKDLLKDVHHKEALGSRTEVESPVFRPKSVYPRLSGIDLATDTNAKIWLAPQPSPLATSNQIFSTPAEYPSTAQSDYFGAPRAQSPESVDRSRKSLETDEQSSTSKSQSSIDSSHRNYESQRGLSYESTSSQGRQPPSSFLSPNAPFARQTPSIRSVTVDSSDEETSGYTPSSSISQLRKDSSSSAVSLPHSPFSTFGRAHARTPSANSDRSHSGSRLSRPAFNFSRPLSRSSRPSTDSRCRQPSQESRTRCSTEETVHTPLSVQEDFFDPSDPQQPDPVPSYIYAKFSLPRGRMLSRNSIPLDHMVPSFEWEQPDIKSIAGPIDTPTEETYPSLHTPPHSLDSERSSPISPEGKSADRHGIVHIRSPPLPTSNVERRRSMTSMNSGSTIKAFQRTEIASVELSAEDHLSKGIDCHERGSLKESTYHLRIAARQNNPTAMLLYALACRHGWGMRPNPQEGVQWLRKAMDCAGIELENDDDPANRGRQGDFNERKTRRAQFALSVYELGVSHMNGWGTDQDKALALRCFETASSWGDADAMAEAGFCYAQGVGCKKNLRTAAKYYRKAEAKGMSMVGNSW